jgi:DNA (cytosine-5)-methyltransferase 1
VRPRALDLFCGAGGASMGLARAGFEVVGVDIKQQPSYPFEFICADALMASLDGFDFVWASPPCQGFTAYRRRPGHVKPQVNLIPQTREKLRGMPHVIENVPGAPLESPVTLCGSMFGLDVKRHRCFETSFRLDAPPCDHGMWTPRFPQATNRKNKRKTVEVGVYRIPLATQQRAMGIDWMKLHELSQAIPPAYSEHIARQFLAQCVVVRQKVPA